MQPHPDHIHKVNASDQDFKIPIAPVEGRKSLVSGSFRLGMAVSAASRMVFDIRGCPRFETTGTVLRRSVLVLYQGTTLVGP
jgi:hypothetical protein